MKNVLVLNCGSSSVKYQLLEMEQERLLAKGLVERIGLAEGRHTCSRPGGDDVVAELPVPDHGTAVQLMLDALTSPAHGVLGSLDDIAAVGHRVVHAGEKYACSVRLDDDVMAALEECVPLAPLHNPANITGIKAARAGRRASADANAAAATAHTGGETETEADTGLGGARHKEGKGRIDILASEMEHGQSLLSLRERFPAAGEVMVAVGPEGGWTKEEADRFLEAGFHQVRLGPRILRLETAASALLTAVQLLWGDFGTSSEEAIGP